MCCYKLNVNPVVGMFHFCLALKSVSVSSVSEQGICIIFFHSMFLLLKFPVLCVYPIEKKITVSVYVFSVVSLCLNKVYWGYRWHLWLLRVAESKWRLLLQMGEQASQFNTEKNNHRDTCINAILELPTPTYPLSGQYLLPWIRRLSTQHFKVK